MCSNQFIGNSDPTSDSFNIGIEPISSPALAAAASTYIARAGVTLMSIAKAFWREAREAWTGIPGPKDRNSQLI